MTITCFHDDRILFENDIIGIHTKFHLYDVLPLESLRSEEVNLMKSA